MDGRFRVRTPAAPNFLNRTVHTGARYHVYAAGKLGDIVYGVTDGAIANAIDQACMKSLFAFNKAKAPFTIGLTTPFPFLSKGDSV